MLLTGGVVFYISAVPANNEAPAAQIIWVKGTVTDISSGQKPRILKRHDMVYQQDSIMTGAGSSDEIVFSDGGLITMGPSRTLRVSEHKSAVGSSSSNDNSIAGVAKSEFREITGEISQQADPDSSQAKASGVTTH